MERNLKPFLHGSVIFPTLVPFLLQVFLPAAVAGNSLAVAAWAFHVAMPFATSFGSLGKKTH